jgi:iron-sulfur cluster assembly protein
MQLTNNAKEEIIRNAKYLKITAQPGGCAGLSYYLEYKNEIAADEKCINDSILTDESSLPFIEDITLDFAQQLGRSEFVITNEQKTSCGCGKSFSI